jgi:hypothetical protein
MAGTARCAVPAKDPRRSRRAGAEVILADVQPQPRAALEAAGAIDEIGAANVTVDIDDALARAYELD